VTRGTALREADRSPWGWAVAGALAGLSLVLVLQAPAAWLSGWVGHWTGGRLLLEDPRGTVWTGSARWTLTGGAGSLDRTSLPDRLAWKLRPDLSGLRLELHAPCCTPSALRLHASPHWAGARLRVLNPVTPEPAAVAEGPATLLTGLGAPWNTLELDGRLTLKTRDLTLDWTGGRLRIDGSAELTARDLASRLSTLRPIGSYRIALAGGSTPSLEMTTLEGALLLQGSGRWVGSRLRFEGSASAAPEREAALANLLNLIGRRSGARSIITVG
jgi:general secretion pathway protein N